MSVKINIEAILKKNVISIAAKGFNNFNDKVRQAIKEIVEAVVDKCAEEAKTKSIEKYDNHETYYENHLDKKSILNVKQMISYE